ncbi:hypothetical protein HOLleu_07974 [Holothuria leucospilota]|uniref:CARD domain-containing protein n=1 Tax=Holothuria leucospilota TaxID=206669 RepID=A0A9Q1CID9_HOLLE|nr:hypothetical protein HOLleu_07974 [Holothuria leucospilota]
MTMDWDQRRALNLALPMLCQDLDVRRCFPPLLAEHLFGEDDIDFINAEPISSLRAIKFIRILKQRGSRAYHVFLNTLRQLEGTIHLAHHIEELHGLSVLGHVQPSSNDGNSVSLFMSGYLIHDNGDATPLMIIIIP